ncbi:MAG: hypothetical protein ACE369_15185 [Roseovarius sp.]
MKIERISLENLCVSPHSGAHVATVLLQSDVMSLSLRASALPGTEDCGLPRNEVVIRALVQDALRQVRRMPEYRNTPQDVVIAETAWPVAAQA